MPMPHRTYKQVIKRRLVGKEGRERMRELRAILAELPTTRTVRTPTCASGSRASSKRPGRGRGGPPRLDLGPARGRRSDRPRGPAERGQVLAAAGALADPDQDRRLRLHDNSAGAGAHAPSRRARPARRDPRPDRRRGGGSRRRPGAARRPARRRRNRPLPRRRAAARTCDTIRAELDRPGIDKPTLVVATKVDETPAPVRLARRVDPGRGEPRRVPRGDLGAHRADPGLPAPPGDEEAEPQPLGPEATVVDAARTIHHEVARLHGGAHGDRRQGSTPSVSAGSTSWPTATRSRC